MAVVVVAEDEEQVRVLAEGIIQEMRHETLSAGTVKEAIAILENDQHIDLLFTNINFPDQLQGEIELAQDAARLRPSIPVLYTTGDELTDGMQVMFVERSAFLPKPYTPEQLIRAITIAGAAEIASGQIVLTLTDNCPAPPQL
jgi:DNA-binding NtrC family response regulator